mmetsp:Transcript_46696/g.87291  ORF Transcript_46696/g.87291 Transcript_46696/m.87291 type:complete len:129 (-) Transcript_46696:99-485(-)
MRGRLIARRCYRGHAKHGLNFLPEHEYFVLAVNIDISEHRLLFSDNRCVVQIHTCDRCPMRSCLRVMPQLFFAPGPNPYLSVVIASMQANAVCMATHSAAFLHIPAPSLMSAVRVTFRKALQQSTQRK